MPSICSIPKLSRALWTAIAKGLVLTLGYHWMHLGNGEITQYHSWTMNFRLTYLQPWRQRRKWRFSELHLAFYTTTTNRIPPTLVVNDDLPSHVMKPYTREKACFSQAEENPSTTILFTHHLLKNEVWPQTSISRRTSYTGSSASWWYLSRLSIIHVLNMFWFVLYPKRPWLMGLLNSPV